MERVNLKVVRGDNKVYVLTLVDKYDVPFDISDWTIYFTVKTKTSDSDDNAVIKKDITSHYDASNGKTQVSLDQVDTNRLGNYYYDIQVKKDDGKVLTPLMGTITFLRDITQRT